MFMHVRVAQKNQVNNWAPSKVKFFAWLAIQYRLSTEDRHEKRGWTNCGICPLCKQTQETAADLFSHCRYTKRVWGMIKEWLGSTISSHKSGRRTYPSRSGGAKCLARASQTARQRPPSPCLLVGWYGRRGKQGSSKISPPHLRSFLRSIRVKLNFGYQRVLSNWVL
jgi:hypothetical protein